MVIFLQAGFHAVEAVKLDEAGAHELVVILICAKTDLGGFQLGEVLLDLLFGGAVREIAWLLY